MKGSGTGKRRRRWAFTLTLLGLATGATLAYALMARRRLLTPEVPMVPWSDDAVSIYAVSGEDASRGWTDASVAERAVAAAAPSVAESAAAPVGAPEGGAPVAAAMGAGAAMAAAAAVGDGDAQDAVDWDEAVAVAAGGDEDEEPGRIRRTNLIEIEGIGPVYAKTLAGLGLVTTADLLAAGANPKAREDLAAASGISKKLILRWVNMADLFRVRGVGEQ